MIFKSRLTLSVVCSKCSTNFVAELTDAAFSSRDVRTFKVFDATSKLFDSVSISDKNIRNFASRVKTSFLSSHCRSNLFLASLKMFEKTFLSFSTSFELLTLSIFLKIWSNSAEANLKIWVQLLKNFFMAVIYECSL